MKRSILLIILLGWLCAPLQVASAHAADMFFHAFTITLDRQSIRVNWALSPGSMLAEAIYNEADLDQDGVVSEQEARRWIEPRLDGFLLQVNDQALAWQIEKASFPDNARQLLIGEASIQAEFTVLLRPSERAVQTLRIKNFYEDLEVNQAISLYAQDELQSVNWFSLQAQDQIAFKTPDLQGSSLQVEYLHSPDKDQQTEFNLSSWESSTPDLPAMVKILGLQDVAQEAAQQAGNRQGLSAVLEGLVRTEQMTPVFLLSAFALALALGALHALGPGHGKTVVAAYLVGSQGKTFHAIALGSIVTLTHTGSVFLLGVLTIVVSRYMMPTDLFPFLEGLSGLLILFLGIGLLIPRLKVLYQNVQLGRQNRKKDAEIVANSDTEKKRLIIDLPIEEKGGAHSHDPSELGSLPRMATIGNPLAGITWRSLLMLGISGGLVPCPDAIAILLIAVAINRVPFGLALIISFSLGLAIVLILIGLTMLQGKRLFQRMQWFDRAATWMPIASALVVIALGFGVLIMAFSKLPMTNQARLQSTPISGSAFDFDHAVMLYSAYDDQSIKQLYQIDLADWEVRQLTYEANQVWDFALSPDESLLAYSTSTQANDSLIKSYNLLSGETRLLLNCGSNQCWEPVWAPDGESFLYYRLEKYEDNSLSTFPSIWWYQLDSEETGAFFQDDQIPGDNITFSANGKLMSYVTVYPLDVKVIDLETGDMKSFALESGATIAWHPTGKQFLISKLIDRNTLLMHLYLIDLETGEQVNLSGDLQSNDYLPVWSPDGEWIAFVRKYKERDVPGFGDQVWLMRKDGSQSYKIEEEQLYAHGTPVWSPDGKWLAFHTYAEQQSADSPAIWIYEIATQELQKLIAPGAYPVWMSSLPADDQITKVDLNAYQRAHR